MLRYVHVSFYWFALDLKQPQGTMAQCLIFETLLNYLSLNVNYERNYCKEYSQNTFKYDPGPLMNKRSYQ